ncbi:MAG TPA: hypothetical protein VLG67_05095 [Candidatus Saccharimonadales bacterium]|nr:hypothetical protein [Candidatus Saccharimonadales bacterium]
MAEETTTETKSNGYGKRPMWQWILIYLIIGGLIYAAVYYFLYANKGGSNTSQSSNPYQTAPQTKPSVATSATPEAMMANEMTVTLAEENNSSQSGTATLKEADGKTTVTLDLTGPASAAAQPAHIHAGACPGVGAVKYPLTSVVDGKSVTVLSVGLAELKKELPLAINVHKSAKEITSYTSCGELK